MKKNYLLGIAAMMATAFGSLEAQVVNGNFENVKSNGNVSNWGTNFLLPVSIDLESGESTPSPITFGCWPGFVFPSWDAHHGQYAMQLTNALNMNDNTVYAGKSILFQDETQDTPGWNPGVPLNPADNVVMLGFYYKFFPMGNDIAQAELVVLNENGEEYGKATVNISAPAFEYQYLYSPLQITEGGTPTTMTISFSMAKEGSVPAFGSTLTVDDVIVNFMALSNSNFQTSNFNIFPTTAENQINIVKGTAAQSGTYEFTISNTEGRIISRQSVQLIDNSPQAIDVSQLSKGIYIVASEGYTAKFIKK